MDKMRYFARRVFRYPLFTYLKHKVNQSSSYAQKNEDLVVKLLLGRVKRFVDIGANDGISGSNTFLFSLQGFQGLCFEPVREIYKRLSDLYLFNSKVLCLNESISDEQRKYKIHVDGVISTIIEIEDPINNL